MARFLRFEHAGAVYQVMARGDGGKAIFIAKDDHLLFLHRLGATNGLRSCSKWAMTDP